MPETLERPHGKLCVWCDVEEFMKLPYSTLHHLTVRAIAKMQAERERELAELTVSWHAMNGGEGR